jgi:hypothetical protein
MRREMLETFPPFFDREIFCLAPILAESGGSGYDLALNGEAKSQEILIDSRTILGQSKDPIPDSRSGQTTGDFQPETEVRLNYSCDARLGR